MGERAEGWMRIIVLIISGIILGFWRIFIQVIGVINFLWTIIAGKRIQDLSELSELWNTQYYTFLRYMTFVTNERPMPFRPISNRISQFEMNR